MTWFEDIKNCISRIDGEEFTLQEIYEQFSVELSELHPTCNTIEASIRENLQYLRNGDAIKLLGNGRYRKQSGLGGAINNGREKRSESVTNLRPTCLQETDIDDPTDTCDRAEIGLLDVKNYLKQNGIEFQVMLERVDHVTDLIMVKRDGEWFRGATIRQQHYYSGTPEDYERYADHLILLSLRIVFAEYLP